MKAIVIPISEGSSAENFIRDKVIYFNLQNKMINKSEDYFYVTIDEDRFILLHTEKPRLALVRQGETLIQTWISDTPPEQLRNLGSLPMSYVLLDWKEAEFLITGGTYESCCSR